MLVIEDLHVSIHEHKILHGINLTVKPGEVHAIMGPNGSGKSTLASVLTGRSECQIEKGKITYQGNELSALNTEERALAGIFLAFQYPVEIPGVNNLYFLKTAYNSLRAFRHEAEMDAMDFMTLVQEKMKILAMDDRFIKRSVNVDFSGGEKKRNEILQMLVLEPTLSIMDEIDSGLDIDSLQIIAQGVNHLRASNRSMIMITHYQRLLNYIKPDFIHVLANGTIIKSGDASLAHELEKKGYGWLQQADVV